MQNNHHNQKDVLKTTIIQGGMGVGVSNWNLAQEVAKNGGLGVVSGTGIDNVFIRRLQDGDQNGMIRKAIEVFPDQTLAWNIYDEFFEKPILDTQNGVRTKPYKQIPLFTVNPPAKIQQIMALASFTEVTLAKMGHNGFIGMNLLEKTQICNLPALFGAMLANVDVILMGAGIPREIPGVLDLFSEFKKASLKIPTIAELSPDKNLDDKNLENKNTEVRTEFDPQMIFPNIKIKNLKRPKFLAIVSSPTLALHLTKKANGKVDGFIVETPEAGGHNAPPRGGIKLNNKGEPIYSERDRSDVSEYLKLNLPIWFAGNYSSPEKIKSITHNGGVGVQLGSIFALSNESGLLSDLKKSLIDDWKKSEDKSDIIFTDPKASPTGFPFKVHNNQNTLSAEENYSKRNRVCNLGYLRDTVVKVNGELTYRCSAEPVSHYVKKGGREEDTIGRKCLCNALMSNIGLGQLKNGTAESPLVTIGSELSFIDFLTKNSSNYSVKDVFQYLKETH